MDASSNSLNALKAEEYFPHVFPVIDEFTSFCKFSTHTGLLAAAESNIFDGSTILCKWNLVWSEYFASLGFSTKRKNIGQSSGKHQVSGENKSLVAY